MSVTNEIRRTGNAVKSAANDATDAITDQVSGMAGQVQNAAQEQMDKLAVAIRRNPLQSTAIAAGLGFLFALVARR